MNNNSLEFTYLGQDFTLDLVNGVLLSDNIELKDTILQAMVSKDASLGGNGTPFYDMEINEPLKNAEQFALCFYQRVNNTEKDFPVSLEQYLPTYEVVEHDYSELSEAESDVFKEIHTGILY